MHLDHLSFAAGPEGLEATAQRLGALLGVSFLDGGFHLVSAPATRSCR
jgi:hypothetical protein